MKICLIEACEIKSRANGFCPKHYMSQDPKGSETAKRIAFRRCLRDAGWTEERFIVFNYAQGGLCYLCAGVSYQKDKLMRLCADHDHETMEPRGLLCQKCNSAIWLYEDADMASRVEGYIR